MSIGVISYRTPMRIYYIMMEMIMEIMMEMMIEMISVKIMFRGKKCAKNFS